MIKFCGNCGAKIDDNARACGQCGTPVEDFIAIRSIKASSPKKNKKIFKLVMGLILVAVVAAVVINVVSKFTGYNGLIRKTMAAYEGYDINTLVSLSSDIYYYGEDDNVEEYFKDHVSATLDMFESTIGHDYKFSYKVNDLYRLSDYKAIEMMDNIEEFYPDFDISTIQDIFITDITVSASKGEKICSKDIQITMTKESESRKVLYID